ncbi:MAG: VanW family protein [Peptoniphilaceae bacterium]
MDFLKNIGKDKKLISLVIITIIFIISVVFYLNEVKSTNIHKGIKVSSIDVSNLTKEEARDKVEKIKIDEIRNGEFLFKLSDEKYYLSYEELGYNLDMNGAIDEAYDIGRSNSLFKNYFNIVSSVIINKNIKINESFNQEKLDEAINYLVTKIYKEPVNAQVYYDDESGFKILNSEKGRYVDAKTLKELIENNILDKKDIEIPIFVSSPKIVESEFEGINSLFAEFSTDYSKSVNNRKDNIALGAKHLGNLLIKPGEEVSFNNTVGDISTDTGFKNATVIVNGEFDQGVGGGICQVSTTLYNALIRSDVEILERSNHTRPISYVPLGTDAAVAQGYKDLKFKNNMNHNIYIKSFADGNNLKFQIFGNSADKDYEVEIVPKLLGVDSPRTIEKYSDKLYEGEVKVEKSGAKGYSYATYKQIVKNGEILKTDKISNSNYISQDRVVIIGEGKSSDEVKDHDEKISSKKSNTSKNTDKS